LDSCQGGDQWREDGGLSPSQQQIIGHLHEPKDTKALKKLCLFEIQYLTIIE
jgi:hypothetical protein